MNITARAIKTLVLVVFVVAVGYGVYFWQSSKQQVRILFNGEHQGLKINIHRAKGFSEERDFNVYKNKDSFVGEYTENTNIKLKKGTYLLSSTENPTYKTREEIFTVGGHKVELSITPSLSVKSLQERLITEGPSVRALIESTFPKKQTNYELSKETLYEDGTWYGVLLTPKTEYSNLYGYVDSYKLIANKVGGKWQIITRPPELVISKKKYPAVPVTIIQSINSSFVEPTAQ